MWRITFIADEATKEIVAEVEAEDGVKSRSGAVRKQSSRFL